MLKLDLVSPRCRTKAPRRFFVVSRHSWSIAAAFGFLGAIFVSLKPFGFDRDCWQYLRHFQQSTVFPVGDYEIGYEILAFLTRSGGLGFSALYFLVVFFALAVKFKILAASRAGWLGLLFYVAVAMPLHEYTQIRAAIGISLGYLGVYLVSREGRVGFGLVFLVAAGLFHLSATVFILPYLCALVNVRGRSTVFIIVLGAVGFFYSLLAASEDLLLVGSRVSYYVDPTGSDQKILTAQNVMAGLLLGLGLMAYKNIEAHRLQCWYIFSWVLYVCPIMITEIMPTVAGRMFELSFLSYALWVTRLRGVVAYAARPLMFLWLSYAFYRYARIDGVFDGQICGF